MPASPTSVEFHYHLSDDLSFVYWTEDSNPEPERLVNTTVLGTSKNPNKKLSVSRMIQMLDVTDYGYKIVELPKIKEENTI